MEDRLSQHAANIISSSKFLLSRENGALTAYQDGFVREILDCMETFITLYTDFICTTPEQITSSMRHDLGNSIMPVVGYAELLARPGVGKLNTDQQALVNSIKTDIEVLRLTVLDLVAKAREYTNNSRLG